ncbi:hypothetical protein ACT17_27980 [Mycolicibacterium conceptionense]|uniref:CYTH domain-containing protein n=1 Tax=Mycolicibacterium conceptionense TaxID=451644 RepID=A0A0J8TZL7_9MYCO|nr:class IV adenylate cyclase [Mycolicibacterium conceptionense]KMV14818.1 hypothetical protein ACT17_27980 [Mycolicibacterium conceptionense]
MREVEIMARLDDLQAFTSKLVEMSAIVGEEMHQDDRIYVPAPLALREVDAHVTPILRVRVEDGKTKLTLKRNAQPGPDSLNNIEHEVEVSDAQTADSILREMGQHVCMRVKKIRRLAEMNGFELCIDSVEGLGDFVEVEALTETADDVEGTRERMWLLLEELGVNRAAQVTKSYDRQIDEMHQLGQQTPHDSTLNGG